MLILNEENCPLDRVAPFVWYQMERERMTTMVRLGGKLIAYLPHSQRSYYAWSAVFSYRPAQHISVHQFSPAHLRIILFGRWEMGLIMGSWALGLKLRQPLMWLKRLQVA